MRRSVLSFTQTCQRLALVALPLAVFGCTPADDVLAPLQELNQRIASALERPPATLSYSPRPDNMPAVSELKPAAQGASMSFLTSLRLGHCRAGQIIAQRNSSLGRLADGVARYQQDISLLAALKDCKTQPKSAPIADELQQAITIKQQQQTRDRALAIATEEALRNSLTIGSPALITLDTASFTPALTALQSITRWLAAPTATADLSADLKVLAQSDYLGQLLRTTIAATLRLQQLRQQLPDLAAAAGCQSKGVPERAKVLRTVFMRFYVSESQPQLAELSRQQTMFNETLAKLQQQVPQPELQSYLAELQQWNQRLKQQNRLFVEPWQAFYQACGFNPGQS